MSSLPIVITGHSVSPGSLPRTVSSHAKGWVQPLDYPCKHSCSGREHSPSSVCVEKASDTAVWVTA
jgi:hypothetical protein